MASKSRYQLVNRGRPGKPAWYVTNSVTGSDTFVSSRRAIAQGHLSMCRRLEPAERERDARLAQGYHLPGL